MIKHLDIDDSLTRSLIVAKMLVSWDCLMNVVFIQPIYSSASKLIFDVVTDNAALAINE